MENLVIFESNINDGPFSLKKDYYPIGFTFERIKKDYKRRLDVLGQSYGFDSNKLIVPTQLERQCSRKELIVNDDLLNEVLWDQYFYYDMVVLQEQYKHVPVAVPIADCPVLICYDKQQNTTVLGHCGAREINRYLPMKLVNTLKEFSNVSNKDIKVYISSCIAKDSYIYNKYPEFAINFDVWNDSIIKKDNYYFIDLRSSIKRQLNNIGIQNDNICFNMQDTYSDPTLYSNSAASHGFSKKKGRYLAGCYFN